MSAVNTPYYVIKKGLLKNNIDSFVEGMKSNWKKTKLSYSVKTNSLPWLLKYMNSNGILAEVVSDEEYELAKKCGFLDQDIIFNGPIKGASKLIDALGNGAFVNIDSESDIRAIQNSNIIGSRIGIRVNIPSTLFSSDDIGYVDSGFRFGFCVENGDFERVLNRLKCNCDISKIGLHMHCNSITRSPEVYRQIARYIVSIVEKYDINPSFLDFGGGFFGGVQGKPESKEYFHIIANELNKTSKVKESLLIAEPGSALIGSAVDLYTSVIDVKDTFKSRIVTTDGSRILLDPLWKKNSYSYSIESDSDKKMKTQIICGYTCMDHDRIMTLKDESDLTVGNRIIYHKVGAYTMTFGGPFIRYFPDVYVESKTGIEQVRHRMSVNDYYDINN